MSSSIEELVIVYCVSAFRSHQPPCNYLSTMAYQILDVFQGCGVCYFIYGVNYVQTLLSYVRSHEGARLYDSQYIMSAFQSDLSKLVPEASPQSISIWGYQRIMYGH